MHRTVFCGFAQTGGESRANAAHRLLAWYLRRITSPLISGRSRVPAPAPCLKQERSQKTIMAGTLFTCYLAYVVEKTDATHWNPGTLKIIAAIQELRRLRKFWSIWGLPLSPRKRLSAQAVGCQCLAAEGDFRGFDSAPSSCVDSIRKRRFRMFRHPSAVICASDDYPLA